LHIIIFAYNEKTNFVINKNMNTKEILLLARYRNTPQRYDFIEILNNEESLETDEFKQIFIKKSRANVATFYRILADFRAHWFIHKINESDKEYILLCKEVKNWRIPSMKFELTHCHNCWTIEDTHDSDSKNTICSFKETHLENCSNCIANN